MGERPTFGFQGLVRAEQLMEVVARTPPKITNEAFTNELRKIAQGTAIDLPRAEKRPKVEQQKIGFWQNKPTM